MHKTFSPQSFNVYNYGSGIPITRKNIDEEQRRRAENKDNPATPEEIVMTFVSVAEQSGKWFKNSNRYQKLVDRVNGIMRKG